MQPVKIVIPGRYWDSFIYRGDLYLWDVNGSIRTIDWDRLVSEWKIESNLRFALECAFLRNDYLYRMRYELLFEDSDVLDLVISKFLQLSQASLTIEHKELCTYEKGQQDNPFPFPHSDLEVYDRRAYVAGTSGVVNASIGRGTKFPISTRAKRQWDAPVQRISAGYGALALAAGNEGLYESSLTNPYRRQGNRTNGDPVQISDDDCSDCNWTYWSIFASSSNGGFLASFQMESDSQTPKQELPSFQEDDYETNIREFDRVITCREMWGQQSYTWGVQDKFCLASEGSIKIIRYEPWEKKLPMRRMGTIPVEALLSKDIISATTAPFGIIIELDNSILVLNSREDLFDLKGEPSSWRIFPRAQRHFNQLHVIREDCLEIYSFNNDYFVNQRKKLAGIRVGGMRQGYSFRQRKRYVRLV